MIYKQKRWFSPDDEIETYLLKDIEYEVDDKEDEFIKYYMECMNWKIKEQTRLEIIVDEASFVWFILHIIRIYEEFKEMKAGKNE
ncbi:MAG TPA: hypothetical protein PKI34_01185 [Bacteroidales bacterium]|nr:hypothetical protein [Bacteroidales bacterium]